MHAATKWICMHVNVLKIEIDFFTRGIRVF